MSAHIELATLIDIVKPEKYLEVGIFNGYNLLQVKAPYKVGIDIAPKIDSRYPITVYKGKSDDVFKSEEFRKEGKFDVIFIDADHEYKQAIKDLKNSLKILNDFGVIVCHDVFPFDNLHIPNLTAKKMPAPNAKWTGDVWKLIFYVRWCMPELNYVVTRNFPGFLFIWKLDEPRKISKLELKENLGYISYVSDRIDKLDTDWALDKFDLMNIVNVSELKRKIYG